MHHALVETSRSSFGVGPTGARRTFAAICLGAVLAGCIGGGDAKQSGGPPYTEDEFEARVEAGERAIGEQVLAHEPRDNLRAGGSRVLPYHECDYDSLTPDQIGIEANTFGVGASDMVIQLARCGDAALAAYKPLFEEHGQATAYEEFVRIEREMDAAIGQ